ncbi:hypothetical protein ACSAZK_04330 [Methanosarcina sp. Mfa9]
MKKETPKPAITAASPVLSQALKVRSLSSRARWRATLLFSCASFSS